MTQDVPHSPADGLQSRGRRRLLAALLGVPWGAKLWARLPPFQLTSPPVAPGLSLDAINALTLREVLPTVNDNFFKASPLLAYLREGRPRYAQQPQQLPLAGIDDWDVPDDLSDDEDDW